MSKYDESNYPYYVEDYEEEILYREYKILESNQINTRLLCSVNLDIPVFDFMEIEDYKIESNTFKEKVRRLFDIDMASLKRSSRGNILVDPITGNINRIYDPQNLEQDIFIPLR